MSDLANAYIDMRSTANRSEPRPRFGERERERSDDREETDEDTLFEVRERFRRVIDWEGRFRSAFTDDVKFANGDSDNHWQWPDTMFADRDAARRPSLTVNKTRQHCLQVINDAKQNKPQIRINPVSDEATKASADVYEGVIRHIEYISSAQVAYDTATEHQVQGGIGWWRVITQYESPDAFEIGCRIQRIGDALSVYMDPDIQEVDGSDALYAFVVDDVTREIFEAKYPEYKDRIPQATFAGQVIPGGWLTEDHVRVAEYYRRSLRDDTLHLLMDGSTMRESEVEGGEALAQMRAASLRKRTLREDRIEWFKIVGGEIVDRARWPGRYIPLVRVVGEETVINGQLERKGHVRALKDPQRIYNFWTSSGVESVALQSKTPYVAAAESIETFQGYWDTANTENHSVLPYNARDDQGQPLPPPQRQQPPQMPQAYIQGMQIAQSEMAMVSGQYQPSMGQPQPAEQSGKAIALRQRQGDNSTYHYVDNLAIAIRFTGRILLDLIPKIYDTRRIMQILAPDGSVDRVVLDPTQRQALQHVPNPAQAQAAGGLTPPTPQQALTASVTRIFNPTVGKYEVQADVGPAYATKRQQAFEAFHQIIATAPQVMNVAGDLLFKAADFPMAEELAERLQRLVPPQALGTGPTPQEQAMQQQLQGAQAHVALLSERLAVAEMKVKGKDEQKDIDAYEATTKRLGTLLSMKDTDSPYADATEVRLLIGQMVQDALKQSGMAPVSNAAMGDLQRMQQQNVMQGPGPPPPVNGAGQPQIPSALTGGQMASLSPQRPPIQRPPGAPPFRGVTGPRP
jgi:hypothetical protein